MVGVTGVLEFSHSWGGGCWIFGKWGSIIASTKSQITSFVVTSSFQLLPVSLPNNGVCRTRSRSRVVSLRHIDFSEEVPWQPFSDDNIDALKADKAIFIDFTADWCLSCKVNEKNVIETETVRNAMKERGIIPVKADWTRRDDTISRWLKEYGKAGVPFYLYIDANVKAYPLPEVC